MNDTGRTRLIAEQASLLDADARTRFLETECGTDPDLRTQVDALLAAMPAGVTGRAGARSGQCLGPWRLREMIGSGGMGSVYRAERADGAFEKPVAIKLLLFDAGDLRTRFAIEQRILGTLSHPNIASLIDAGLDDNGAPYLVMEFVEGLSITAWAKRHELDLRARLEVFLKILDAVQVAHRQLIVHRDIKPGNVLVDIHGEPKLLDFGIAKLLGDNQPSATRTGLGPLTPEYASPEQIRGDPIGLASDIYSLGVLLFELVTGERPYKIDGARMSTLERIICETDPPRPSTRLVSRRYRGNGRDLDAIVLKAMAKAPAQRYASAAAFAEDIERWLAGREVLARQPPLSERTLRLLRKHRVAAAVALTATITLVAGSAVALWQAHLAREQAQRANHERDRAERINQFLADTLAAANPADLGRKATVVQVLDRARKLADTSLANDPRSSADVHLVLAQTYRSLGEAGAAQACAEAALAAARRTGDHESIIDAQSTLGTVYFDKANLPLARAAFTAVHAEAMAHGTAHQRASASIQLGQLENEAGNPRQGLEWLQRGMQELPADALLERAGATDAIGYAKTLLGDVQGAIALREQAIAMLREKFPQGHPLIVTMSVNLAQAYEQARRTDEAIALLDRVLPEQIRLLGENNSDVLWTLTTLAAIERRHERNAAALDYARRAWQIAQTLGDDNDWKAYAYEKYGAALSATGDPRAAIPVLEQALRIDRALLPADHHQISAVEGELALAESLIEGKPSGLAKAQTAYERTAAKYGATSQFATAAQDRVERIRAVGNPRGTP